MTKTHVLSAIIGLIIGLVLGWVLLNYGVKKTDINWKFGTSELSINLEQDLADVSTMLNKVFSEDYSKNGTIEWLKENQNIFESKDPELADQIASLNYKDLLAKELREISKKRIGPWAYQFDTIRFGIPNANDQPRVGSANVCENGVFFTKKIKLFNMDLSTSIVLNASGRYECPLNLAFPDIQLNKEDAKTLLGTQHFSKYENAVALILTRE